MIEFALRRDGATTSPSRDARRVLQLLLAATWLMDGLLQHQSFMYAKAFGQILAGDATDPNSAPLLTLLSLAYWPLAMAGPRARRPQADGPFAMTAGRTEEKFA